MANELLALLQVQSYFFTSLPLSGRAWQICVPSSKYFRCRRASQSPMCSPFLFKVCQTLHCRKVHSTRKNSLLAKDLIIYNSISWLLSTRNYKSTNASFHILCSQTAISFRYFTTTPYAFKVALKFDQAISYFRKKLLKFYHIARHRGCCCVERVNTINLAEIFSF